MLLRRATVRARSGGMVGVGGLRVVAWVFRREKGRAQGSEGLFSNAPEGGIAAEVEGVAGEGGGAEDSGGKVQLSGDSALGGGGVDGLQETTFADGVKGFMGEDGAGT